MCAAGEDEMKRKMRAYMTLEAAMVFPAVFALVIMLLYGMFFLYDKCRMTQDLYTAAYRRSIARNESANNNPVDSTAFLMLRDCSVQISGGREITACADAVIEPAFLAGTGEEGTQWKIGVTMRARRTDPPLEFRRFRRVTAIADMLTGK